MTTGAIYGDSFSAYSNAGGISSVLQQKVDNVAENEVLFPNVDYLKGYNSVLDSYQSNLSKLEESDGSVSADNGLTSGDSSSVSGELAQDGGSKATEEQIAQLRAAYEQIQDDQGWVGKAWNGIKNFFGHSNGSNAVEETLSKAEAGEISYEAAVEKLNNYAQKQDSIVDTFANVASGLAVAAGVLAAPLSFGASLAVGAGVGAAVKVGIKASDKATNDVAGDYTFKDGLKDGITGGVGGVVTAATAGIGTAGMVAAKEGGKVLVKETIKQGVIAGAKAGAIDGAVMSATNYTADAVFDGDEFTFGGLVSTTVSGTLTGAAVGGVAGGVTSGVSAVKYNKAVDASDVLNARNLSIDDELKNLDNFDADDLISAKQTAIDDIDTKLEGLDSVKDGTQIRQLKQQKEYLEADVAQLKKSGNVEDYTKYLKGEQASITKEIKANTKTIQKGDATKIENQGDEDALNAAKTLKKGDSANQTDVDNLIAARDNLAKKLEDPNLTYAEKQAYKTQLKEYNKTVKKLQDNGFIDADYKVVDKSASADVQSTATEPQKQVYMEDGRVASSDWQRSEVLYDKVDSGEIKTLQDAYDAGFTEAELKRNRLYDDLFNAENQISTTASAKQLDGTTQKPVYKKNGKVANTDAQRAKVLRDKVDANEIKTLQDAYEAGFTKSELQKSNLYNKLNAAEQQAQKAAAQTAQSGAAQQTGSQSGAAQQTGSQSGAAQQTGSQSGADSATTSSTKLTQKAADKIKNGLTKLLKSGASAKNMTKKEAIEALTGKASASASELKAAFDAMKETSEYKTNLVFRTFLLDLLQTANAN